jgi:hypothetical protein
LEEAQGVSHINIRRNSSFPEQPEVLGESRASEDA